jgi:hypothetical protein
LPRRRLGANVYIGSDALSPSRQSAAGFAQEFVAFGGCFHSGAHPHDVSIDGDSDKISMAGVRRIDTELHTGPPGIGPLLLGAARKCARPGGLGRARAAGLHDPDNVWEERASTARS